VYTTLAACSVLAGVLLLAIAAALLLLRRRRRHKLQLMQQHLPSSKHGPDIIVTAGDGGAATDTDTQSDRALQATLLFRYAHCADVPLRQRLALLRSRTCAIVSSMQDAVTHVPWSGLWLSNNQTG
jgi:hypothetical protein